MKLRLPLLAPIALFILVASGWAQTEVLWGSVRVPLPVSMDISEAEEVENAYEVTPKSGGPGSISIASFTSELSLTGYRAAITQSILADGGKVFSQAIKGKTLTMHYLLKAPESQLYNRYLTKVTARSDDYVAVMMTSLDIEWNTASRRSLNRVFNGIRVEQTGILDQLVGTWNTLRIRRYGGQKWGFSSEYIVTKTGVGSFSARAVTFSEDFGDVFSDFSYNRDGSFGGRSYVGETTIESASGTWEIKGGRLYTLEFWASPDGSYRASGSLRRVNQNKWAGSGTIQGGIRSSISMTRVR